MAFRGGRLEEVALDRYAQADDGSVWYLGEDVFDYRRGTISSTEGTWLAGREGPPAMIMPGHPRIGDVFRTENVPGVVFEEVTVRDVGRIVTGPRGALGGAMIGSELHLDGSRSGKIFTPGYGEFFTADSGDVEALALAVAADALPAPVPPQLRALSTGAVGTLESVRAPDWEAVDATVAQLPAAWRAVAAGAPPRIAKPLVAKLGALRRAVTRRDVAAVSQLAIDVNRLALDLELRHRSAVAVDVDRFQLWTQQLRVDASAHDMAGVTGSVAVLEWMRARVAPALRPAELRALDEGLRDLRGAADDGNLATAADHAARLGARLRRASRA
jgi:hypothetical protein